MNTVPESDIQLTSTDITVEIQLFPHSEVPLHRQEQSRPFLFTPVETKVTLGREVQIGRKIDRSKEQRGSTREDRAAHNVSLDASHMSATEGLANCDCISFRSKVVSRHHAELYLGKDGVLYFKDVGSSSGTFLNRLRLSPSGKESRPYPINSGDIIQLGVDYQGRQEGRNDFTVEIYKAVMIKIFLNNKKGQPAPASRQKLSKALRSLVYAMNPNSCKEDENCPTDCCICISTMAPFQALFLAPCSHCFHYKCVTTLLGAGFMFQCPLCRQVANLEASVTEPDELVPEEDMDIVDDEELDDVDNTDDRRKTLARPSSNEREMFMSHLSAPVAIPSRTNEMPVVEFISPSTPPNHSAIPQSIRSNSNDQDIPLSLLSQTLKQAVTNGNQESIDNGLMEYNQHLQDVLKESISDPDLLYQLISKLSILSSEQALQ